MRAERTVYLILIISAGGAAFAFWQRAQTLARQDYMLREEVAALKDQIAQGDSAAQSRHAEAEKSKTQTTELMRLRNEVTQLRSGANESVERLRQENQKLRGGGGGPAPVQTLGRQSLAGHDRFPRESWIFADYESPEAALVSAIWAMKEGNPKTYLNSLSPQEQERMAKTWENKNEQEIALKHQSDVSSITGMKILDRQTVSPDEMVMNVFVEGPGRQERVRMNRIGEDWKFGGFIREKQQ
jgi:hypothetical protein